MNKINLSKLDDIKLVNLIRKKNSSEALEELVDRHQKLFFNVCAKYSKKSQHIIYDEIIKDVYFVIGEAVRTFKTDKKAKISTWIGHYSRFYCLKKITYMSKNHYDLNLEESDLEMINVKLNKFDELKIGNMESSIKTILKEIDDQRIQKIFNYRYFDNQYLTWNDIGNKMNISAMHVINLHKIGCSLIKEKLKEEIY